MHKEKEWKFGFELYEMYPEALARAIIEAYTGTENARSWKVWKTMLR